LIVDGSKANKELGFSPMSLEKSLKAQYEWFVKQKRIK